MLHVPLCPYPLSTTCHGHNLAIKQCPECPSPLPSIPPPLVASPTALSRREEKGGGEERRRGEEEEDHTAGAVRVARDKDDAVIFLPVADPHGTATLLHGPNPLPHRHPSLPTTMVRTPAISAHRHGHAILVPPCSSP